MISQLNPPIPVITTKGRALAHFLIDHGPEHHLQWVCFLDKNGECWTFQNPEIRAQKNETYGRNHISAFSNADDDSLSIKNPIMLTDKIMVMCQYCKYLEDICCDDYEEWKCPSGCHIPTVTDCHRITK